MPTFWRAILTHQVGQTGLDFVCDEGSLVGLHTQDYKSLCAAVTSCATMVHSQTDTQTVYMRRMDERKNTE